MTKSNQIVARDRPSDAAATARPVFILGIAERSGTTYLQDLLRLHPDCDADGLELNEDHFVAFSHLLVEFVNSASRHWKAWWGEKELEDDRLLVCRCLGEGLIAYLNQQVCRRRLLTGLAVPDKPLKVLITKTPDVSNLNLFFNIFPNAHLLILVRDGRAVVESAVGTFYRRFEWAARQWADRAATILRFVGECSDPSNKYLVIRYEDLYRDNAKELHRILRFLQLDPMLYDFDSADKLPVRGSSSLRREDAHVTSSHIAPGIHWHPVPRPPNFNPILRWSQWSRAQHERFNWIAGRYLQPLGYEPVTFSGNRWFWTGWNTVLDALPIEKLVWISQKVRRELKQSSNRRETAGDLLRRALRTRKSACRPTEQSYS
jgi:protein-tyrosine sulfotransferase